MAVDAGSRGCGNGVLGERGPLWSAALLYHRATLASWSNGYAAAWPWNRASAVELDPLHAARWKRACFRAGVGGLQVCKSEVDGSSDPLQPVSCVFMFRKGILAVSKN